LSGYRRWTLKQHRETLLTDDPATDDATKAPDQAERFYTPAMLAELLGVPLSLVRRWHRAGAIVPAQEVRRLVYFDFQEVAVAQRMAQLFRAGVSPQNIEKKVADLARLLPGVQRPILDPAVTVQGQSLLVRQGDGLVEAGGQLVFDFDPALVVPASAGAGVPPLGGSLAGPAKAGTPAQMAGVLRSVEDISVSPEQMRVLAAEYEDDGRLSEAADVYRAAMAAAGPDPEACFQLAELLYRQGDLGAARERYYMAIELDENYVEARANLGCVLAEMGQRDLAVAAFEGALHCHPDYADAHYHLARTLDEMGHRRTAEQHWRRFLAQAPGSPWAAEAEQRLQ
jgi:tetratricopeptide (TPR) repeat protein